MARDLSGVRSFMSFMSPSHIAGEVGPQKGDRTLIGMSPPGWAETVWADRHWRHWNWLPCGLPWCIQRLARHSLFHYGDCVVSFLPGVGVADLVRKAGGDGILTYLKPSSFYRSCRDSLILPAPVSPQNVLRCSVVLTSEDAGLKKRWAAEFWKIRFSHRFEKVSTPKLVVQW